MAVCEKCKNPTNYQPHEMFVALDEHLFIGPCCAPTTRSIPVRSPAEVHILPASDDVEYGLEISNRIGVKAYVNYAGLQLSFERSPREIKTWAQKQGLLVEQTG
jgi:hypothetical protein